MFGLFKKKKIESLTDEQIKELTKVLIIDDEEPVELRALLKKEGWKNYHLEDLDALANRRLEYCKENTSLYVSTNIDEDFIEITFDMTSLFFTNQEAKLLSRRGTRGQNSKDIAGSGIGLFAVQNFMRLHSGYLQFSSNELTRHSSGEKCYSENQFILGFAR